MRVFVILIGVAIFVFIATIDTCGPCAPPTLEDRVEAEDVARFAGGMIYPATCWASPGRARTLLVVSKVHDKKAQDRLVESLRKERKRRDWKRIAVAFERVYGKHPGRDVDIE